MDSHKNDDDDRIQVLQELDAWSVIKRIALSGVQDEPFFVCDVSDIVRKYTVWTTILPRVTTHYAVKCNESRVVLETLAALGTGFDCASKEEIRKVLSLGVHPSRIIYANPTKKHSHLRYAADTGVKSMTFDCEHELYKIKDLHPKAKLLIRIKCDDLSALYILGNKFGCNHETEAAHLLRIAFSLNLNVVGVAFHIGSGSKNYSIYDKAFAWSRHVFDEAAKIGYKLNLLDIGGGFPGEKNSSIKEVGECINTSIEKYFSDPSIHITSEPGRYYVNSAFYLVTSIHSIKTVVNANNETSYAYYTDASVYGALMPIIFKEYYRVKALITKMGQEVYPSVVWGPTCDPFDKLFKGTVLPKMNVGDWIVVEDAGAYTLSLSCEFNGIETPKLHSVVDERDWLYLTEKAAFPLPKKIFVEGNDIEQYRTGLTGPSKFRKNYF